MRRRKAPARTLLAGGFLSIVTFGAGSCLAAAPAGPSFDAVLASPNNVGVNIDYAQAQANAGNLLEAAAALERVLIAHPNQVETRLFYAVVLYRLDDLQNASNQLKLLDVGQLSPVQQAEADKYRRLIALRGDSPGKPVNHFGGELAIGANYDSDALGAVLTQFDFIGPAAKQSGYGQVISGDLHGAVPLGPSGDLSLYGSVSGYNRSTLSGPPNQLQTLTGRVGLASVGRARTWSVGGVVRGYRVLNGQYLDEYGAQAKVSWRRSPATSINLTLEAVQQEFDEPLLDAAVSSFGMGGNRDGGRYTADLGVSHRFNARSSASASVGYEYKVATYAPLGYNAPNIQGRWDLLLGRGAYLTSSGEVRWVDYHGFDPIFLFAHRRDTRSNVRAELGAPVSAFTAQGATGDYRENLIVDGALSYSQRESSGGVSGFNDFGAELRLRWRFGSRD